MSSKKVRAPQWTEEKQREAQNEGYYIKVGPDRGKLKLSGAAKKWKVNPELIYLPHYRVVGHPSDVQFVLVEAGESGSSVKKAMKEAYTLTSTEGVLKDAYLAELGEAKKGKKKVVKKTVVVVKGSIADIASMIDTATVEGGKAPRKSPRAKPKKAKKATKSPKKAKKATKSKSPKKATKSKSPKKAKKATKSKSPKAKSPKGGKRKLIPLSEKIAALAAGKVMDVSTLKTDETGAKVILKPKAGGRSKKYLVPGYNIVSDNKRGINNAAKFLDDDRLGPAWEAAKKSSKAAASSPRKTSKGSPKGSPTSR